MSDRPTRVLVVDDDLATRLLACEALAAEGFEAIEAEDGRDGMEQYQRYSPEAVLLDVNMPHLDGYEVCRRIRKLPGGVATSVMVMTATDDVEAVQLAFAAGATDFLTKPLNLPLLAHRVRYMLRAGATATAAHDAAARLARAQRLARLVHWQVGPDGVFSWTGDPLAVLWPGAPAERGPQTDLLSLVHPNHRERVATAMASGGPHQLDYELLLPDGTVRCVHQDADVELTDRGIVLIGATQDVTEVKRAEQQISQLAFYDDLTGIPNRQFVERYLRAVDPDLAWFALVIDLGISHLERLVPAAHDALIRAATARVIENVRGGDHEIRLDQAPRSPEGFGGPTLVAWLGKDQLAVISAADLNPSPVTVARTVSTAMLQGFRVGGEELALRPRFGVASWPGPADELGRLVELAGTALLEAERTAPRDVVVYSEQVRDLQLQRADLARQFAMTLDIASREPHPELAVEYVPRRDPGTRKLVSLLARPRWWLSAQDPRAFAAILDADPVLRHRLAMWTMREACRDAARWAAEGNPVRVAVQVSAGQVAGPVFVPTLRGVFSDEEMDPSQLEIELVTLPSNDRELDQAAAALGALHADGVHVSLARVDDGCAVRHLRRLPIDTLRVDRSTLDRLGPQFLETIVVIAQALALRIAATDIDSPAALAALDPHVLDDLAGAVMGPPLSASAVLAQFEEPRIVRRVAATNSPPLENTIR